VNTSGPGAGGATLSPPPAPPGRALRAVAFTPAVRGYPGGIADMAAEQDDLVEGDAGHSPGSWAGERGATASAGGGRKGVAGAVPGTSVWQQSLTAWQEAGIDWLREARRAPSAEDRAAAEADLQHTQPIPVVPAFDPRGQAGPGERPAAPAGETAAAAAGAGAAGTGAAKAAVDEDVTGEDVMLRSGAEAAAAAPGATSPGEAADDCGSAAAGVAGAVVDEDVIVLGAAGAAASAAKTAQTGETDTATGSGLDGAGPDGTSSVAAASTPAGTVADGTVADGPRAAAGAPQAGPSAAAGQPGRARPRRRAVVVAAVTCVALLAGAIIGVAVARSGPARPTFGPVTPYPPAALADGDFAAPVAGVSVPPSLTGLAAAGKTVVAIGSQGTGPLSIPLILLSGNGGRTWARAALGSSNAATGPGAVPALIVRGQNSWLALGQSSAWTSVDGRVWQAAPGVPMSAGDKVLDLARTRAGFIAVGENVPGPAGTGVPSPVLWTSADGRTWQRKSGAALTLGDSGKIDAGGGSMVSLRWAAYRAGTVIVGGEISQPVVKHRGKRKIIANVDSPGLWRSRNDGVTWQPVKLPASHGATTGLAGLAATGSSFVAIRPGRTRAGRWDAVAYVSGTGATWRYAGSLTGGRHAPLFVTLVSAGQPGVVVSGSTGTSRVAFVSARGRGWHKTADLGAAASTTVTGVTVAPGSVVVTAASRHRLGSQAAGTSPYLLLTGTGARAHRTVVGKAVLAAAGTADVTVNSLAAAGREQVAAGSADGAPALWSATAAGQWVPSTVSMPASWSPGSLTSVVHGSAGWLAVGNAGPSVPPVPLAQPAPSAPAGPVAGSAGVIMTSADGSTWQPGTTAQPLTAPGATLAQAAAGRSGYVVVGSAATPGGGPGPAAWYSAGLSTWTRATISQAGPAGTGGPMLAVAAAQPGFVAVGSAGSAPAVWTSQSGSAWQFTRLPLPAGTVSAVLTQVAAVGGRVVAAGDASRAAVPGHMAGPVPFAAVSGDDGRTWREVILRAPAGPATITALTAAGHGFAAVGLSGVPGDQVMLTWWSPDGLSWQGGQPVAGPLHGRGVQQITALSAVGGALTGAGYAVTQSGDHPLSWHARYR
jgi:hypothetical protein